MVGLPGCELLLKHYTTLKFKSQVLAKTGNESNTLGSSIIELATELFSWNYGAQQSDIGRLRSTWVKTYVVESRPVAAATIFFLLLLQRHEDISYVHIRNTAKLHVVQLPLGYPPPASHSTLEGFRWFTPNPKSLKNITRFWKKQRQVAKSGYEMLMSSETNFSVDALQLGCLAPSFRLKKNHSHHHHHL